MITLSLKKLSTKFTLVLYREHKPSSKPEPRVVLVSIRPRPAVDELVDGCGAAKRVLLIVEGVVVDLHHEHHDQAEDHQAIEVGHIEGGLGEKIYNISNPLLLSFGL